MNIQSTKMAAHALPRVAARRQSTASASEPRDTFQLGPTAASFQPPEDGNIWEDGRPWETRNQPAQLLDKTEDGKTTVSGFRWGWTEAPKVEDWQPTFLNTTIDGSKLKDVHFYVEHFFPAGHGALVFEFEDGAVQGPDGRATNKMVYSIEARKKQGDKWTWKRGLRKTMGMVHQLMTFDDAEQWVTRRQGASLETRKLKLTAEEKQKLLDTCLNEAVQDRTGEYYHTTRNSCYSSLLKVMNKALPDKEVGLKSPLTFGLLMRPESFLTSSYNTVLKNKGLFSGERAQHYLPDPELHPVEHKEGLEKALDVSFLEGVAGQTWFPSVSGLAGGAAGAGLGYMVASQVFGAGPIATGLTMTGLAYLGTGTGLLAGDLFQGQSLRTVVNGDLGLVEESLYR